MSKRYALFGAASVAGWLVLSLGVLVASVYARDDRGVYRALEPGEYHPSFFLEYARALKQDEPWLKNPQAVALSYAGATNLCPDSALRTLPAGPGQRVVVITNRCWAGVFAAKKWRVDLVLVDERWQVDWSGVTYKCARKLTDPGSFLISYNPLRQVRAAWAAPLNSGVRSLGYILNPWQTQCPP